MSINIMSLPHVTEFNTSDSLLLVETSNEGKRMNIASIGPKLAQTYSNGGFYGIAPSGALSDRTDAGVYTVSGSNTYTDLPSGITYGLLEVYKGSASSTIIIQRLTSITGRTFIRFRGSTSFSNWREYSRDDVLLQTGTGSTGGTDGEQTITFPTPFTTVPIVVCTPFNGTANAAVTNVLITAITTTNFTIKKRFWNGSGWSNGTAACRWMAWGSVV